MSYIAIHHLSFAYEDSDQMIFEDLNLDLDGRGRYGLIGRNGKGKSTLLKLIAGFLPTSAIRTDLKPRYFPDQVKDPSLETIDVLRTLYPFSEDYEFMIEADLLELNMERLYVPFALLSSGEKMKALLAGAFSHNHDFLLIDEPTNHLDAHGRDVLGHYLQKKTGFMLVSHDRHLLDLSVDHIIALNKESITLTKGNYATYEEQKQRQDCFEQTQQEKLKKEIKHLKEASEKTRQWSNAVEKSKNGTRNSGLRVDRGFVGHKSAKMMQKAKNAQMRMDRKVKEKSSLLKDVESLESLKLTPLDFGSRPLIEAHHLSLGYEHLVVEDLNFAIQAHDRCVILGGNGSGKSTLIKAIMGEKVNQEGLLKVASGLKIAYVPQEENLSGLLKDYPKVHQLNASLFFAILSKMGFARMAFEKDCTSLSEGMKKKVLLAHALSESAHLYIFDEPLNYIDLQTRLQIEELILKEQPTMLFVEHDAAFVSHVATKIIEINR